MANEFPSRLSTIGYDPFPDGVIQTSLKALNAIQYTSPPEEPANVTPTGTVTNVAEVIFSVVNVSPAYNKSPGVLAPP
jgi:hypothetical protein